MSTLMKVQGAAVHGSGGRLVEPFSFSLEAGRPFTILGETGSGKSLLAQALMGLLPDGLTASGQLFIEGQTLDLSVPGVQKPLWGRKVSILPQEPWLALDPIMAASSQVEESYRFLRNEKTNQARQSADRDLQDLGVAEAARKLPGQLSGGMAQRVAFAAARAGGARIVIADEPTKGLDIARRDEVIDLLMREVRAGGTVLVITHDLALARQMGGDLAVMLEGRIVEQGQAADVLAEPQHEYTKRLIAADPQNWEKLEAEPSTSASCVLSATGLGKTRGGKRLFADIDLAIHPGEIIGVTGPSGSGKSSLGDLLLGLLKPDTGTVRRADGISVHRYQKLYQDPPAAFPARATLKQSLADLLALHRLEEARIAPLMRRLRLGEHLLDRRPDQVSGGELQRFSLLRVLLLDPVFLFADEPTSRLDLITQQETIALLVELARERSSALLLVSHDTALIEKTCDRTISIG
ncbi:ATP-binding cassette domain-containing protein [Rhizobium sp. FKY42]|uniref:ABC transporter ATP-binding protein n=1 Tax=Rhizobium sp. FKY42 TaxID=2562310 RepID=UPI0010C0A3BB|nr:ATP-binding cassette domain-containing protein [Rhizobium sp. FKY42]